MQTISMSGYQFIHLTDLSALRAAFLQHCHALGLKGTILLSPEGININLAGTPSAIGQFKDYLYSHPHFVGMSFRESDAERPPFRTLKVKIKKEIITFRDADCDPVKTRGSSITPEMFKQWLDEGRDITVLDTRNHYEIECGTFNQAMHLQLNHFTDFKAAAKTLPSDKPIVMFCTGGVRCEKAALYLLNQGMTQVYQLEGGILNYFEKVGSAHYHGDCYVFDDRLAVDAQLRPAKNASLSLKS